MLVGVDYDTWALYLCAYDPNDDRGPLWAKADLRTKGQPQDAAFGNVGGALGRCYLSLHHQRDPTDTRDITAWPLWVERGRGGNRNVDWCLGAVCGAIFAASRAHRGDRPVRLIDANQWKSNLGATSAKEAAHRKINLYHQTKHPGQPLPTDPNLLDAYGIAIAATTR